jgi:hypothetical protein
MPVLGAGGAVKLIREAPEAVVLPSSALAANYNSIYLRNPEFWSGDEVLLFAGGGLPIDTGDDGPDCPDGYAAYQESPWFIGTNRSHIENNADLFYSQAGNSPFYMNEDECGLTTGGIFYIYRDQLDRVSFYTKRSDALNGHPNNRIRLYNVDYGSMILAPAGGADYNNAVAKCVLYMGEEWTSDTQDEATLRSICSFAPDYTGPAAGTADYDNSDIQPRWYINNTDDSGVLWILQCDLAGWSLNLDSRQVETTAVGEKFGDAVKSVVNGGGSFDFIVDRRTTENQGDSTELMKLLLLTEKGCKAKAQFWMITDADRPDTMPPGGLYYEATILITGTAVNVRPTEVIAGSADFVTVGEIALKMGAY